MATPTTNPTDEKIAARPWKYVGYNGFAEWMGSSDDFLMVRRFNSLGARVILQQQWELIRLERRLSMIDEKYQKATAMQHNGRFADDPLDRQNVLREAEVRLKNYNDFLASYAWLKARPDAPKEARSNVREWLDSRGSAIDPSANAIDPSETEFLDSEDLVLVTSANRIPLRRTLEKLSLFREARVFQDKTRTPSKHNEIFGLDKLHYNDQRMNTIVNAIICVVGLGMLVAPIWILFFVSSRRDQLITITVFITFFLILVQAVSAARPLESLAATAAYSAVLMVFIQIDPQGVAPS